MGAAIALGSKASTPSLSLTDEFLYPYVLPFPSKRRWGCGGAVECPLLHETPLPTSASKRLRPAALVSDPTNPDPHAALSNRIHIIFLGTEGYLYRPIDLILTSNLQIPPSPANRLLAALHRHAIYYLHTLIRHRRALDFSPSDASTPPPHHSHDPP